MSGRDRLTGISTTSAAYGAVTKYNSGAEKLSLERVNQIISYDPETGALTWKSGRKKGLPAGTKNGGGYIRLKICGIDIAAHRLAWFLTYHRWPSACIDHIDHDTANNMISNLREATVSQNAQNARNKGYTRQSRGGGFLARIKAGDRVLCLGTYPTEEEARAAYVAASLKHFGEFSPFYNGGHQ